MDWGDAAFAVLHFRDVAGDDAASGGEIFLAEGGILDNFGECFGEGVEEGDGVESFEVSGEGFEVVASGSLKQGG